MNRPPRPHFRASGSPATGLARALSKLGFCSRSRAWELIRAGRVRLNGTLCRNPEQPVDWKRDRVEVDGRDIRAAARVYLMLNKPRGLVTSAADEQGRQTVFACLADRDLPHMAPVGRLDKASEGLLLFTNDTAWAARITAPETHLEKVYHVQVDCVADEVLVQRLVQGVNAEGDFLAAKRAAILRHGQRNSWLEIVLDEGKNRHLRRLLEALHLEVPRLIRIAIGSLKLGNLAKGAVRALTPDEVAALGRESASP